MNRLQGKVAIITGAASGMGAAHAKAFVSEGAKVAITDLDVKRGEALAAQLGRKNAIFIPHDVTNSGNWDKVIAETEKAFGPVNVLVNNAGVSQAQPLEEVTEAQYKTIIDINQVSVFLGMQKVLPSMRRANGGSIVNISSIAGIAAAPGAIAYSASKFAVRGMTKVAAIEFAKDNIRVNSVHPGYINTAMMSVVPPDVLEQMKSTIPLKRIAEPEEVSAMVVYLASDDSKYSTGSEFIVDGGLTAQM